MIAAYNLAQRMASLPRELYSSYSNLGRQEWTTLTRPINTYGKLTVLDDRGNDRLWCVSC